MRKSMIAFLLLATSLQGQTTGEAAVEAKASNWQTWVFIATAAVTATAAVLIIAMNEGQDAPNH